MKDIKFLKDKIIAHRGYHNIKENIPENSLLAFKKAIRYKYVLNFVGNENSESLIDEQSLNTNKNKE